MLTSLFFHLIKWTQCHDNNKWETKFLNRSKHLFNKRRHGKQNVYALCSSHADNFIFFFHLLVLSHINVWPSENLTKKKSRVTPPLPPPPRCLCSDVILRLKQSVCLSITQPLACWVGQDSSLLKCTCHGKSVSPKLCAITGLRLIVLLHFKRPLDSARGDELLQRLLSATCTLAHGCTFSWHFCLKKTHTHKFLTS